MGAVKGKRSLRMIVNQMNDFEYSGKSKAFIQSITHTIHIEMKGGKKLTSLYGIANSSLLGRL